MLPFYSKRIQFRIKYYIQFSCLLSLVTYVFCWISWPQKFYDYRLIISQNFPQFGLWNVSSLLDWGYPSCRHYYKDFAEFYWILTNGTEFQFVTLLIKVTLISWLKIRLPAFSLKLLFPPYQLIIICREVLWFYINIPFLTFQLIYSWIYINMELCYSIILNE